MKKRRYLTLIEIMIVIVLIGLIGSVVAYNMRGSLDQGKVFKTEQGGSQIYNILMLEVAKGAPIEEVARDWKDFVQRSPLAKNPDKLVRDGWGKEYEVILSSDHDDLIVTSTAKGFHAKALR